MGGFFDSGDKTSIGGKPAGERSDGEKPVGEKPDGEKFNDEKPDDEKSNSHKPSGEPTATLNLLKMQSIYEAPEFYPGLFKLKKDEYAQPGLAQDIPRMLVTKSDIVDRSKKDALGKLAASLQTTWFIVQYSERWASHQARTQLEVLTLSYAAVNIFIYILWKEKPLRVQEPIDVRGNTTPANARQETLRKAGWTVVSEAWGSLVDGMKTEPGRVVLPVIGVLFGGVHCLAWGFPFPTESETMLWRVCAIYCTVVPVVFPGAGLLSQYRLKLKLPDPSPDPPDDLDRLDRPDHTNRPGRLRRLMYAAMQCVHITGYIVCRIILLVLTLTSLRATPPDIYAATDWTCFLPHVA